MICSYLTFSVSKKARLCIRSQRNRILTHIILSIQCALRSVPMPLPIVIEQRGDDDDNDECKDEDDDEDDDKEENGKGNK